MAERQHPPHDRGGKLWNPSGGASRLLISSFDRWTSALLADDGVDMPFMGGSENIEAKIFARGEGVLVGCAAVDHMLQIWAGGLDISWSCTDGRSVSSGDEIAIIRGDKEAIFSLERTILNILGQLSGIATEAKKWSTKAPGQIACTRKTIWGLMDKWAVHLGGGLSHRLSRNDAKMVKENDLAAMYPELDSHGARIGRLISEIDVNEVGAFLEIEVRQEKEAILAAFAWSEKRMTTGCDRLVLMLDNFGPERCNAVCSELDEMGLREHVCIEASGGIVLDDLEDWRKCGVDVLSTSTINRGTTPLDLSMLANSA
jgi:nicotinate-nucleotide pyrophosphorylase (carboxylating)